MSSRPLIGVALLLGALVSVGCGSPGAESASPTEGQPASPDHPAAVDESESGSVSFELDVGRTRLDLARYTIVGNGFQTSGTLDISKSTRISGFVGGIPFGTGYAVTLNATSAAPVVLSCDGSASFDVTSTVPVPVTVPVHCKAKKVAEFVATPAPVPPAAIAALWLLLFGVGVGMQQRAARKA